MHPGQARRPRPSARAPGSACDRPGCRRGGPPPGCCPSPAPDSRSASGAGAGGARRPGRRTATRRRGSRAEQLGGRTGRSTALDLSGGTTARESLTTSDSPRYIDSVPSVMMITGIRSPTARSAVDEAEQAAEGDADAGARGTGRARATSAMAAMTAEKLNIQPIDRSMSRMATTNTMPSASMPMKARARELLDQRDGREEGRAQDADDDDQGDERDDDAGLVGQAAQASTEVGGGRGRSCGHVSPHFARPTKPRTMLTSADPTRDPEPGQKIQETFAVGRVALADQVGATIDLDTPPRHSCPGHGR